MGETDNTTGRRGPRWSRPAVSSMILCPVQLISAVTLMLQLALVFFNFFWRTSARILSDQDSQKRSRSKMRWNCSGNAESNHNISGDRQVQRATRWKHLEMKPMLNLLMFCSLHSRCKGSTVVAEWNCGTGPTLCENGNTRTQP